jgi:hypothetical protein
MEGSTREHLFDGGAHFYTTYPTADSKAVAVGAIEPRFYAALLRGLGLSEAGLPAQHERVRLACDAAASGSLVCHTPTRLTGAVYSRYGSLCVARAVPGRTA